jgi:hypothetical protein
MFEAAQMVADILPLQAKHDAAVSPKRDRRLTLTRIDKRGRLGKERHGENFLAPVELPPPKVSHRPRRGANLQQFATHSRS